MKLVLSITLTAFFIVIFGCTAEAKSWRGIVPMHTTRGKVIEMFGIGSNQKDPGSRFDLPGEEVSIIYSTKDFYPSRLYECIKQLPLDVVLQINVVPHPQPTFASLGFTEAAFRKVVANQEHPLRSNGFIDDQEGLVVSVKETVEQVTYVPTKADRARCPEYYANLESRIYEIFCILCPTISVACPDQVEPGNKIVFSVNFTTDGSAKERYNWKVDEGTIVEGQGTSSITVDASKSNRKVVTATVELGGIDPACPKTASCSTKVP
jgi:hypothetical protein